MKKYVKCLIMALTVITLSSTACRLPSKTAICAMFGGQCVT